MLTSGVKFFRVAALLGALCCATVLDAEILTMNSLDQVARKFTDSLRRTPAEAMLGVFEIDMVLLQPSEAALQAATKKSYQVFLKKMLANLTPQQNDILLNLVAKSSKSILINEKNPAIIKKIASKGIKLIAVSPSLTGQVATVPRFEVWRYKCLKKLGIDFSRSFRRTPEIKFNEMKEYYGRFPIFYKGVLCSNGAAASYTPGDVFIRFLQKTKFKPETIIFVAASQEHVMQLENAIKSFNPKINFIGIHYVAAESFMSGPVEQSDFVKTWSTMIEDAQGLSEKM